jgi:hypothetical protein
MCHAAGCDLWQIILSRREGLLLVCSSMLSHDGEGREVLVSEVGTTIVKGVGVVVRT